VSVYLHGILEALTAAHGTDVLLRTNAPVYFRVGSRMIRADVPLAGEEEMDVALKTVAGVDKLAELDRVGEASTLYRTDEGERYRVTAFRQRGSFGLVLRHMPPEAPPVEELGVPEAMRAIPRLRRGLVVLTGQAGAGKTTTLASLMADLIASGPLRILSLEDPVEMRAPTGPALVSQREIGRDVESFAVGLRAARHQDLDIVLVGDIPDAETLDLALTLASSGQLVYVLLTAGGAVRALERLLEFYPPARREQMLERLATTVRGVLGQHLLTGSDGVSRIPAFELLLPGPEVRRAIRSDKLEELPKLMEVARGCLPLKNTVAQLLKSGRITVEEAQRLFPSLGKA
jgi:twitching motility protein PilT